MTVVQIENESFVEGQPVIAQVKDIRDVQTSNGHSKRYILSDDELDWADKNYTTSPVEVGDWVMVVRSLSSFSTLIVARARLNGAISGPEYMIDTPDLKNLS